MRRLQNSLSAFFQKSDHPKEKHITKEQSDDYLSKFLLKLPSLPPIGVDFQI